MAKTRSLEFSGLAARLQYHLLMGLFRLAVTRGLYGRFARGLGLVFDPENSVLLRTGQSAPFRIHLNDGYWTRFALYHHPYEPEVENILTTASGLTDLFCDLGANKGYWTTRASSLFSRVLAVEASAQTFLHLSENAAHLPNVTLHQAAIHSTSGQQMTFLNTHLSHASARLLDTDYGSPEDKTERVQTLRIDDLVPSGTAALIKLDVEGAEVSAIDGATRALGDGAVLIYEDHGSDPDCVPSAHLLSLGDIRLYSIEKTPEPAISVAAIRALKTDRFKGYNFLAARSDSPLLAALLERFAKP
ncbi:hypothetical protein PEL8287_02219 [Roseovarius litorisediminis]|uniref:Methyltransferase FkbM domain-containing protein n=1 Tax=Roseovarius litorisediminis TaxID=1312363 RepID=A0A1Y5SS42_9RHOB|nr:FkbM family methyltransferase [Roseovarius litorisediminis]SLN43980.1 hypothetical protein PEL8287_02219 [Roseovarius litorisediminis]